MIRIGGGGGAGGAGFGRALRQSRGRLVLECSRLVFGGALLFRAFVNGFEYSVIQDDHEHRGDVERRHRRVDEKVGVEEAAVAVFPVGAFVHAQDDGTRDGHRHDPSQNQHDVHAVGIFMLCIFDRLSNGVKPEKREKDNKMSFFSLRRIGNLRAELQFPRYITIKHISQLSKTSQIISS